jgi:hypothetical protein
MRNDKSPHILNASSNLLGICFVVLTSLRVLKLTATTFIDELTAITMVSLIVSCIFSFLSIRSLSNRAAHYERVADMIFMMALVLMFVTTMLIMFDVV